MNKKLITLAVAAVVAAPMAASAEVTIYGVGHVSYDGIKYDGEKRTYDVVGNSGASAGHASRLGFKGSEDLGGGLKAIWKMEFAFDQADTSTLSSNRNSYVGLASDSWGTALLGRHDTPYKMSVGSYDLFADQLGDFNGTVGFEDIRSSNVIAYVSPDFGGFNLAAAAVTDNNDNAAEAFSIGGNFAMAGLKVSLAYEDLGDVALGSTLAEKKWGVAGSYEMGAFGIMARYDGGKDIATVNNVDYDAWQVGGKFGFGNNVIKAMYGENDRDDELDKIKTWSVGLDHNLSKRTQAYAQWVDSKDRWDGFSLGMVHKF